jgi:hypothetical protein
LFSVPRSTNGSPGDVDAPGKRSAKNAGHLGVTHNREADEIPAIVG